VQKQTLTPTLTIRIPSSTTSSSSSSSSSKLKQHEHQHQQPLSSLVASDDIDLSFSSRSNLNPNTLSPLSLQDDQVEVDELEYFDKAKNNNNNINNNNMAKIIPLQLLSIEKQSWKSSTSSKASPMSIKSWIALSVNFGWTG